IRLYHLFFFSSRRRHTISTRDWSSDVCSSDLIADLHRRIKEEAPKLRAAAEAKAAKAAAELAKRNKVPKVAVTLPADAKVVKQRSEERRVGKECRSQGEHRE